MKAWWWGLLGVQFVFMAFACMNTSNHVLFVGLWCTDFLIGAFIASTSIIDRARR
jgi:hypothetical protein